MVLYKSDDVFCLLSEYSIIKWNTKLTTCLIKYNFKIISNKYTNHNWYLLIAAVFKTYL
jgi:hypothetical protein